MTVSWVKTGNILIGTLFAVGLINMIWLSVYGFYLPAKLRVGLSTPQAVTTLTVIVASLLINRAMLKGSLVHGPVQWGKISIRGMVVLFGSGWRLYVGHGPHGIYPVVRPVVVACERIDGRRLALGLHAGTWVCRQDGDAQHGRVLERGARAVLDVPTGPAAGAGRRIVRYALQTFAPAPSQEV